MKHIQSVTNNYELLLRYV